MLLRVLLLLCAFPLSTAKHRLREFHKGDDPKNRMDAVSECRTKYTDLATVYDQQDDMELSELLPSSPPTGWIGAQRGNLTKKWSNGDEVTYRQDCGESPCETGCAAMKANGEWECQQCNNKIQFMCYDQDVGQTSYNYTFISEKKTWFEAQLYCREKHTDLATIRNEEENKQAMDKRDSGGTPFWIGLLVDNVEWKDGGQSAYRNWKPDPPLLNDYNVYIFKTPPVNRLQWSKSETDKYHPLCYKSFIHVSEGVMSWEKGLDYCNSHQNTSGLLRIESEDDQTETERELKRREISGPVWVGLRQSRLFGFWIWSNGITVGNWTNWKEGSEPEHHVSEHCGALQNVNGPYKWFDKDCRSEFRVLCEVK